MTDWENYESGPYCKHWGDPLDCDDCKKMCKCGHTNFFHDYERYPYMDTNCQECNCLEFDEE